MRIVMRSTPRAFLALGGLVGVLALLPGWAASQEQVTIAGRVTGAQGEPLRDANVGIFDLGIGVWTGPDGSYRLVVPAGRVQGQTVKLGTRLIGYRAQSFNVTLAPGATLQQNFQLAADPLRLEEIVVTGAGTEQLREKLGTAAATVDAATFMTEFAVNNQRPEILDNFNLDGILRKYWLNQGASAAFIRPMREVITMRDARANC